jgi:hypothetical protein
MRPVAELKKLRKLPEKRQEAFSLYATLDQYEVKELDPRQLEILVNRARRKHGTPPPDAA